MRQWAELFIIAIYLVSSNNANEECNCERSFRPVCGTDSNTYNNECKLNCAGTELSYKGTCCQKACHTYNDPVCDSRGITHQNECWFLHEKCTLRKSKSVIIKIVRRGSCDLLEPCTTDCTEDGNHVCDGLGKTYTSKCAYNLENCYRKRNNTAPIPFGYNGACESYTTNPPTKDIITTAPSVTTTVTTIGQMETTESLKQITETPLDPIITTTTTIPTTLPDTTSMETKQPTNNLQELADDCQIPCAESDFFICGTDGHTYRNPCYFENAMCLAKKAGKQLDILVDGKCPASLRIITKAKPTTTVLTTTSATESCSTNCPTTVTPVCDSVGKTHRNKCEFDKYNCDMLHQKKDQMTIDHVGACIPSVKPQNHTETPTTVSGECPFNCSSNYDPVCDSKGVTHSNKCMFQFANCLSRQIGRDGSALLKVGVCATQVTTDSTLTTADYDFDLFKFDCDDFECPPIYQPICDEHGITHENLCLFDQASCRFAKANLGKLIKKAKDGPCNTAERETVEVNPAAGGFSGTGVCNFDCSADSFDPVCDSKNKTHANQCMFNYHQCISEQINQLMNPIQLAHKGACPNDIMNQSSIPTNVNDSQAPAPVAASLALPDALKGCGDEECEGKIDPVCDQRGATYPNMCEFKFQKCIQHKLKGLELELSYVGECVVHNIDIPVQTVTKLPDADAAIMTTGTLRPGIACVDDCNSENDPVCDNRAKTHINICKFNHKNCKYQQKNKVLYIVHFGSCRNSSSSAEENATDSQMLVSHETCNFFCEDKSARAVCDSAGKKFSDLCQFNERNCKLSKAQQELIKLGESSDCADSNAPMKSSVDCWAYKCMLGGYFPICDTRGKEHTNLCFFNQANCFKQNEANNTELFLAYFGGCKESTDFDAEAAKANECDDAEATNCPNKYDPVCDSNGHTHKNLCFFTYMNCQLRRWGEKLVEIDQIGPCQTSAPTVMPTLPETTSANITPKPKVLNPDHMMCPTECLPPTGADVVCDNHKQTYQSLCLFKQVLCHGNDQLVPIAFAECNLLPADFPVSICETHCPDHFDPVCDYNGKTHQNLCTYNSERCLIKSISGTSLRIAYRGLCKRVHAVVTTLQPVTTTSETTTSTTTIPTPTTTTSSSTTTTTTTTTATTSSSQTKRTSSSITIELSPPVAEPETVPESGNGTEEMLVVPEHSVDSPALTVRKETLVMIPVVVEASSTTHKPEYECPGVESCQLELHPLCDTMNKTQPNLCVFNYQRCITQKTTQQDLGLNHLGACDGGSALLDLTNENCNLECDGVNTVEICDENSVTYDNVCFYMVADCKKRAATGFGVDIANIGTCPQDKANPGFEIGNLVQIDENEVDANEATTPHQALDPAIALKCARQCTREFNPLCDTSGTSHPNFCMFLKASCIHSELSGMQLGISRPGPCNPSDLTGDSSSPFPECQQECSNETRLLCDSMNKTHTNLCTFRNAMCHHVQMTGETISVQHFGSCGFPVTHNEVSCPELTNCNRRIGPICDSTGKTHQDECTFRAAQCSERKQGVILVAAHHGECDDVSADCDAIDCSTEIRIPVCDSGFRTHRNPCEFKRSKCYERRNSGKSFAILFEGECSVCTKPCRAIFEPICSTLKKTHPNECEFEISQCVHSRRFNETISIAYDGPCCERQCPPIGKQDPLCDNLGQTHLSTCHFEIQQCHNRMNGLPDIQIEQSQACSNAVGNGDLRAKQPDSASACYQDCKPILSPLCASNGKTYLNDCQFKVEKCQKEHNLTIVYRGECCQITTECPLVYSPVCDTHGNTHINPCHFSNVKCKAEKEDQTILQVAYNGQCCKGNCKGHTLSPVCDSEGKTHSNVCEFGRAQCIMKRTRKKEIQISQYSPCPLNVCMKDCSSTAYEPTCGSDGETYMNQCSMQIKSCLRQQNGREAINVQYKGACCSMECSYKYDPVCDTSGQTHPNQCVFESHSCKSLRKSGKALTIANFGPCCRQPCTDQPEPVCDSRGRTHNNFCHLKVTQCEAAYQEGSTITLAYKGECCQRQSNCTQQKVMCDSSGTTHENECDFQFAACVENRKGHSNLTVSYLGQCCPLELCPEYRPLCDNNGQTHKNLCQFHNHKCIHERMGRTQGTLDVDYTGECCKMNSECAKTGLIDNVCDQHGKVYKNRCEFDYEECRMKNKKQPTLLIATCPQRL